MYCPLCDVKMDVVDSRMDKKTRTVITRRRECPECLTRFSTTEKIDFTKCSPTIIKKLHEKMDRQKVLT